METVGQRIKRLREERGLSQREIASPGSGYAYISRIEGGGRAPSIKALRMIAEKLGTSVYYLEHGYQQMVYILVLTSLEEPGHVLAVLHDEKEAHELEEWFLEQGHIVHLQQEPADDAEVIAALKQQYERKPEPPGVP